MVVTADSAVLMVSPKADGVRLVRTPTSNGSDEYTVTFDGVAVPDSDVLAGAQTNGAHRVNQLALAAIGAYVDGLVAGALRLTADYVANRKQFGNMLTGVDHLSATYDRYKQAFTKGEPEWGAHLADELTRLSMPRRAGTGTWRTN